MSGMAGVGLLLGPGAGDGAAGSPGRRRGPPTPAPFPVCSTAVLICSRNDWLMSVRGFLPASPSQKQLPLLPSGHSLHSVPWAFNFDGLSIPLSPPSLPHPSQVSTLSPP